jgi:hypothetical protein
MHKLTLTLATLVVAASSIALADEAKAPAASERRAPTPKPAGGAPMPTGSGSAAAVVAPPPKQAPAMPEMKPPQEIADAAKLMVGSYKCKGNVMNPDGSSRPSLGSMKVSVELDGFYILVDMMEQKTKENPTPFKAHMFRTFDAAAKKWTNTMIAAAPGGPMTETSTDAMGSGPVTWTGTMEMMGQKMTERGHEEPDAKTKSVHLWGEVSMDGGKTFAKEYDLTCKK